MEARNVQTSETMKMAKNSNNDDDDDEDDDDKRTIITKFGFHWRNFATRNDVILKPSFYMIAHDRRIAENTASDRQRLCRNTFQRSGDRQRLYGDSSAIG